MSRRRRSSRPPRWRRSALGVPEEAIARLDREAVSRALTHLPRDQRLAIVLMDLAGLTASEAAEALGCPRNTVLSWVHRGRKRLAVHLVEQDLSRDAALRSASSPSWPVISRPRRSASSTSTSSSARAAGGRSRPTEWDASPSSACGSRRRRGFATGSRSPISLEKPRGASHRRRRRARHRRGAVELAAALFVVLAVGGTLAGAARRRTATDPSQVAAVVAMVTPDGHPSAALLAGERQVVDRQQMTVRAYMVHGKEAIVATSMKPLPMPATSHLLAGSSPRAWMATDGTLALYGVNRPAGQPSMFVVAAMPMAALPQVAAQLHLI